MLTVMFGDQTVGTHTIKHVPFVVGRDPSNDVPIDNVGISRRHCQVVWEERNRHFHIQDLDSANGTFHRGHKVRMAPLADGDEVLLGKYKLVFHQAAGEGPPPEKGGGKGELAAMVEGAKPGRPSPPGDVMKTFMVDSGALHKQAESSVQRASDLAGSFAPKKEAKSSNALLWVVVAAMGMIIAALGVVIFLLTRQAG
jgi:predicted component of type VI protein secretion system